MVYCLDEDGIGSGTNARIAFIFLLLNCRQHKKKKKTPKDGSRHYRGDPDTAKRKKEKNTEKTTMFFFSAADYEFSTAPAFTHPSTLFVSYRPSRSFVLVLHGSLRGKEPPRHGFLEGLGGMTFKRLCFALYKVVGAHFVGCIVLYFWAAGTLAAHQCRLEAGCSFPRLLYSIFLITTDTSCFYMLSPATLGIGLRPIRIRPC